MKSSTSTPTTSRGRTSAWVMAASAAWSRAALAATEGSPDATRDNASDRLRVCAAPIEGADNVASAALIASVRRRRADGRATRRENMTETVSRAGVADAAPHVTRRLSLGSRGSWEVVRGRKCASLVSGYPAQTHAARRTRRVEQPPLQPSPVQPIRHRHDGDGCRADGRPDLCRRVGARDDRRHGLV